MLVLVLALPCSAQCPQHYISPCMNCEETGSCPRFVADQTEAGRSYVKCRAPAGRGQPPNRRRGHAGGQPSGAPGRTLLQLSPMPTRWGVQELLRVLYQFVKHTTQGDACAAPRHTTLFIRIAVAAHVPKGWQ